jgi:hypothetical protein
VRRTDQVQQGRPKGQRTATCVEIEDIEKMRLSEGIEDVELRNEIRGLRVGDFVRLTLMTGTEPVTAETLLVRITRISGRAFRGKLADTPACTALAQVPARASVRFTATHIHSIPKRQARNGR